MALSSHSIFLPLPLPSYFRVKIPRFLRENDNLNDTQFPTTIKTLIIISLVVLILDTYFYNYNYKDTIVE